MNQESREMNSEIITLEEFQKLDLRVGKVLIAEKVKGSEKLLKLEVNPFF